MGQMGFYDLDKRLEAISAKGDPLELIKVTVPWESFRAEIEATTCCFSFTSRAAESSREVQRLVVPSGHANAS
jgi:hypothetical protein